MHYLRSVGARSSIIMFLVAAPASRGWAEMQILQTNVPKYVVGTIVSDDAKFDLGPNCYVRVLMLPSRETFLFEGPKTQTSPVLGTRGKHTPRPC